MKRAALLLILPTAVLLFASLATASSVTFASYVQADNHPDFSLVSTSLGGGNFSVRMSASGLVNFTYLVAGTPFGSMAQPATLKYDATNTGECEDRTGASCNMDGQFSIVRTEPLNDESNLLSGVFHIMPIGGPSGQSHDEKLDTTIESNGQSSKPTQIASNASQVQFSSDFLNVAGTGPGTANFTLSSLTPSFGGFTANSFTLGQGSFTATSFTPGSAMFTLDAAPIGGLSAVPEPATLFLIGSVLVGLGWLVRRRIA